MNESSRHAELTAYALITPAMLLLGALFFFPLIGVIAIAFTDWQFGERAITFVGFSNFIDLARDPVFWKSLRNTLIYVVCVVSCSVILGLAVALIVESGKSLRSFYRAAHFIPVVATFAAMAVAW